MRIKNYFTPQWPQLVSRRPHKPQPQHLHPQPHRSPQPQFKTLVVNPNAISITLKAYVIDDVMLQLLAKS
jgi:hypothetical protein